MPPRRGVVTIAALALLAVGGVSAWHFGMQPVFAKSSARGQQQAQPEIPVTVGTAGKQDVPNYVEGLGAVQAFNTVTVKTRIDGSITQLFFKEGQDVKIGDPLFQIDPRPYQAILQQMNAAKQRDEAQLQAAQLDLARFTQLLERQFQTRQSYDQQKAAVAQLQASIKSDQAQIDTAQLNLDYTLIRSPIDGRTGQRAIDIGNYVQAGQNGGLLTITQLQPIFVNFSVPADRLSEIRKNQAEQPLKVIAYAMDDKTSRAEGVVTLIDNQVDATTGTVRLKGQFENVGEPLWPGQFVNARIVLSILQNAVTIPVDAALQGPTGPYVYVLGDGDTVKRRDIDVSVSQDGISVVAKGLAAGERIVLDGQYRLADGAKVKIGNPQQADSNTQTAP